MLKLRASNRRRTERVLPDRVHPNEYHLIHVAASQGDMQMLSKRFYTPWNFIKSKLHFYAEAIIWPVFQLLEISFCYVKLHLNQGANVNAQVNKSGHFPLFFAVVHKPAVLRSLLENGAKIDQKTTLESRTALHEACRNADEECIKILISAGADMLIHDNNVYTPFVYLTNRRNTDIDCQKN
ncbi:hypothetical protein TSAR_013199 [Trichomalopsis sarcophagae]|uniref:Uncharacterized protein n=1 Tax=Trichomalopsis sarcophagae TaxID=543379 RepID=A0A232F799_9HYME|nr:hypothetical protein TSAR_013199 [Trichomalopsis sarcophagae]